MTTKTAASTLALATALLCPSAAAAQLKTGQSPDCRRFCMSVKPREAAEGSVFRFAGNHWRPNRRVTATFGVYCRPREVCIDIAYIVRVRTDDTGRFVFRLRAGPEQAGDDRRRIHSGSAPTFSQTTRSGRTAARRPRYRVTVTS